MHQFGFVHRDLKPDNMILTQDLKVKFLDYGFTTEVDSNGLARGCCGTKGYIAPEILSKPVYNGALADIYSMGRVLYFMVAPETSWKNIEAKVSKECRHFLMKTICEQPEKRLSIDEIKKHPWLSSGIPTKKQVIWLLKDTLS